MFHVFMFQSNINMTKTFLQLSDRLQTHLNRSKMVRHM